MSGPGPLDSVLLPNAGFQSLSADDCPCDDPRHREHTASTLLSVQRAFLALPWSPDSWLLARVPSHGDIDSALLTWVMSGAGPITGPAASGHPADQQCCAESKWIFKRGLFKNL